MNDDHAICNPAGSCCTPNANDDAIREAAVEALALIPGTYAAYPHSVAMTVIDAVRPLIEAQLRERLAAAIEERAAEGLDPEQREYMAAARIVRERP